MSSCSSVQPKRVVVTGMGTISSLGNSSNTFWENLIAGKSGISRITCFDVTDYPCKVGSQVKDFDPNEFMGAKEVRHNDPYTHYAVAAAKQAVEDSGLDITKTNKERFGVIIGSGIGGLQTIQTQSERLHQLGPRKVSPFMIPALIVNIATGVVAIEVGAMGPSMTTVSACASGSHAIGVSLNHLRYGMADVMITGGSEASITALGYAGFCSMRAMSTSFNDTPEKSSRPFDAKRDGFVMGEGAGILVLETLEHALARNAFIYCELIGYASTSDAYHITAPDPEGKGIEMCIKNALNDANVLPENVDYINAHGTSTMQNDKSETRALKSIFKENAFNIPVSSTKSMTGHLLGAAGGIEAAIIAKVIQKGEIPPTINYEEPDPECDLNYVPNKKIKKDVNIAMTNSIGFGGHNVSIIMKAYKTEDKKG